jgi:hypothetical protein
MRVYIKQNTKAEQQANELLRAYGMKFELERDRRGSYFDATPPPHWNESRRERFLAALQQFAAR